MPVVCSQLRTLSPLRPCLKDEEARLGAVKLLVLRHSIQVASRMRFQHGLSKLTQTPTALLLVLGPSAGSMQQGLVLTASCRTVWHIVAFWPPVSSWHSPTDTGPSADTQAEGERGTRAECADRVCPPAPPRQEVPEGPGTAEGMVVSPRSPQPLPPRLRDACLPRCCRH